jgi:hypothetical protein
VRSKHPTEWVTLLREEKTKAAEACAKQEEADKLLEQIEGDPDELEEDLSQPMVVLFC